ncbi:MAG: hypothetical protein HS108_13195 [Planctomycetes bacterium]|jgi:hypothetical protein|nr:hypothetical protein [Planctomycetota bacterium]MCL4730137.1 hypothetical protein [Planctomycetota bacterium]
MRWTIAVALAVASVTAFGCQDNEARVQNAQLRAELEALKSKETGKVDPVLAAILNRDGGAGDATDRKLNALAEDLRSYKDAISKEISAADAADKRRFEELESRLKKVSDLEASLVTLKATIDGLDGKLKAGNPEETLRLQKEIFQADVALTQEKRLREAAEARITQLEADLKAALDNANSLVERMKGLEGADISRHPEYQKAQKEIRALKAEIALMKSDIQNLKDANSALEAENARLGGKGAGVVKPVESSKYDFTGTVLVVNMGSRPGAASNLLVRMDSGQIPPVGATMVVLDSKAEIVCKVKVVRHYHVDDKPENAVEEIGCATLDEKANKPVTKGDQVVWLKSADNIEPKKPDDKGGAAGGN